MNERSTTSTAQPEHQTPTAQGQAVPENAFETAPPSLFQQRLVTDLTASNSHRIRRAAATRLQRQVGNRAVTQLIQREFNRTTGVLTLGTFQFRTYGELQALARFGIAQLRADLDGVDEYASERTRANQWITGMQAWQSYLTAHAAENITEAGAAQAQLWYDELISVREAIERSKRSAAIAELQRAQQAIEGRQAQLRAMQPQLDEQLRQAYLTNNTDTIGQVVSFIASTTDIGTGLADISRQLAQGISTLRGTGAIPPASQYTTLLQRFNSVIVAINFVYNYQNSTSNTEIGQATAQINNLTSAFATGSTLLALAPHIGLYCNLYLGPAVQIATARVEAILRRYSRQWAEFDLATGRQPDMRNHEGGADMFDFMVQVMNADGIESMPAVPSVASTYILNNRDRIGTAAGDAVPTRRSWIFWRQLDQGRIQDWVYVNRRRMWAMLYGNWDVPPAGTRSRR